MLVSFGAGHTVTALYEVTPAGKEPTKDLKEKTDGGPMETGYSVDRQRHR